MGGFFSLLIAKIVGAITWVGSLFVAVFVALWDIFKDIFSWLFEQILTIAVSAVSAVDVSGMQGLSGQGWGALPAEVLNILQLIGVGSAIGIISSAIAVRFALQLIPFVRLGS